MQNAGIDLHSNNAMIGLVDMEGNRLQHKKVACELKGVLEVLTERIPSSEEI